MRKTLIIFACIFVSILVINGASALSLNVEKETISNVVISEVGNPAIFEFEITNNGVAEDVEIYSFVGVSIEPKGRFELSSGTTIIEVKAYPSEGIRGMYSGPFVFEYQIMSFGNGNYEDEMLIRLVNLEDVIEVYDVNLFPGDDKVEIKFRNTKDINLEDVTLRFTSDFFDFEELLSFGPFEAKSVEKGVDLGRARSLKAGPYLLTTSVEIEDAKAEIGSTINYLEKEGVSVNRGTTGFLIRETTVIKTNEGNVPVMADVDVKKDIFSRLFTTFSISPENSGRSGFIVKYEWNEVLEPGKSLVIKSSTNYTFPFFVIALVVLIGLLSKFYTKRYVIMTKRVSRMRTKGGELALRVIVRVKSKKNVNNVRIIDQIPIMTKLYNKFGRSPDKIDEKTRRLFWNIDKLNSGEERVFSYIIYSKINVVGRFEIPSASVVYNLDGKDEMTISNRTFFIADTIGT